MAHFSLSKHLHLARHYLLIFVLLIGGWGISHVTQPLIETGLYTHNALSLLPLLEAIIILIFGFLAYETARRTIIPSFVLAIAIGMIQKHSLEPLITHADVLSLLTTVGAAFILFGGGLDTPFKRFRELFWPILSIAFVGTLATALLTSLSLSSIATTLNLTIPIGAIVLLGAAIASTDPAAIIPSFKSLIFRAPRVKDIAISESAINDVLGAVLTGLFVTIVSMGSAHESIAALYRELFTIHTGADIMREILVGGVVGVVGFGILHGWSHWKKSNEEGGEADAALFMAVPLFCYFAAVFFYGSGFLAVFIAGLLFRLEDHISHVEHYFVHTIEGFMKPLIFILLGAIVDVDSLLQFALPGILMGALFMFVIRPLAVFVSLGVFMAGKYSLSVRELFFLSFVRETGVIPAVLLIGLLSAGIQGAESIVPIGLWVILLTLIVQPPLTPLIARALRIADAAPPFPSRPNGEPIAVLCSRGFSFSSRLESVAAWAGDHGVQRIVLLHCPEDRFSESFVRDVQEKATRCFRGINAARSAKNESALSFECLALPGLLHDNIRSLIAADHVSIIFVGKKMLDYRLEEVKNINAPFVFID